MVVRDARPGVVRVIIVPNGELLLEEDLGVPLFGVDSVTPVLVEVLPSVQFEVSQVFVIALLIFERLARNQVPSIELALQAEANKLSIDHPRGEELVSVLHADEGLGVSVKEGDDLNFLIVWLIDESLVLAAEVHLALAADVDFAIEHN